MHYLACSLYIPVILTGLENSSNLTCFFSMSGCRGALLCYYDAKFRYFNKIFYLVATMPRWENEYERSYDHEVRSLQYYRRCCIR